MSVSYFQVMELEKIKMRRKKVIEETTLKFDETRLQEHCWSRTESALIKCIAMDYRENGEPEDHLIVYHLNALS